MLLRTTFFPLCRRPPPTMRRPCAILLRCDLAARGKRMFGRVLGEKGSLLDRLPAESKTNVFWGASAPPTCIFPVAGCVAKRLNPATGHRGASDPVVRDTAEGLGPEGLPSGTGPAALCRRPPQTTRYTFALRQAGPTLIRGEGFADLFRLFLAAF